MHCFSIFQVMLEAEAEESKEQIREQTSANRKKQQARLKTRLRHLLFGMNGVAFIAFPKIEGEKSI